MSQPILSISESEATAGSKTTVNLLPCRVDHDGPVTPVTPFWSPKKDEDGSSVAYFRGRKLQSKTVKLPEEYRGVLLEREVKPENKTGWKPDVEVVNVDDDEEEETEKMRTVGEFDEMVIWGHDAVTDATEDPYVRGIEEWLQLSEQMHSTPAVDKKDGK